MGKWALTSGQNLRTPVTCEPQVFHCDELRDAVSLGRRQEVDAHHLLCLSGDKKTFSAPKRHRSRENWGCLALRDERRLLFWTVSLSVVHDTSARLLISSIRVCREKYLKFQKGSSSRRFTLIPRGFKHSYRSNYSSRLLTLGDLLEPQHILRRDDGLSAQFFFSSNRDAHVWRVAALLHFHVQRGGKLLRE